MMRGQHRPPAAFDRRRQARAQLPGEIGVADHHVGFARQQQGEGVDVR
jgi:hypothetical protein